ncbi:sensor histidine kinase [Dinghuibacter silviterrae]|uniref:Histidine kinase n=1 Tax=Dinghuibacter silviterrae TaxID=1539049 RepID=A0A4R8DTR9_9BACT|nr:histidine kinase [Dinghuibacter silviterrae]TDX01318.1 histidine kinase [Dinghuibacter silviterrae]
MNLVETIRHYQRKYRLASHLLFWALFLQVAISASKYYDGRHFSYRFELITDGLYQVPEMLAAYFLTYWVVPQFVTKKRYVLASVGFLAGAYAICVLGRFIIVRVCEPLAGIPPEAFETNRELLTNIPKLIYRYFFQIFDIATFFLFIRLLLQQLDTQKRTLTLEKEKIATELKLLKAQLNPHFLFNTLNNIYALSLANSPATASSIAKLSEILDYILYRCDGSLVPLDGEVGVLEDYLALERLRYDDRLQLRFERTVTAPAQVPPLLLLSLAENAFKHGASQDMGRPCIEISLRVDAEGLVYSVANTVVAPRGGSASRPAPGSIGLANVRRQLDYLFPGQHTFVAGLEGNVFRTRLFLNLKSATNGHPVPAR